MIRDIRQEIALRMRDVPYPFSVSAGFDALADGQDTIQACIRRADKKLYLDKECRKSDPARPSAS